MHLPPFSPNPIKGAFYFTRDPVTRAALIASTTAFAVWLTQEALPFLFQHGELLAPIAISNALAAGAIYLTFDLAHGGPKNLLLWKGVR